MTCPDPSGILPIQISVTQPDRRVLQTIPSTLSPPRPAQPRRSHPSATPNPPPETRDGANAPPQTKTSVSTPHASGSSRLSLARTPTHNRTPTISISEPPILARGPTHDSSKRSPRRTRTATTHAMIGIGSTGRRKARAHSSATTSIKHLAARSSRRTTSLLEAGNGPSQRRRGEKMNADPDPQRDPTSRKT